MNYSSLFNLLYSTEISEDTKLSITNKIEEPIQESTEIEPLTETYMELLDTLVFSTASESLIYDIIDETFSSLDEEFINEVSNEWVKRKVQDSMTARKNAADNADKSVKSGIVGLSQLRRQDKAHQDLAKGAEKAGSIMNKVDRRKAVEQSTKAPEALNRLKSSVGKVKSWVSSVDKGPEHVGLSRAIGAKANKDNIGAETLRQQTTHQAQAPKTTARSERIAQAQKRAQGTKLPSGETIRVGSTEQPKLLAKTATKIKNTQKATKAPSEKEFNRTLKVGDKIHNQVQKDIAKLDKEQAKRNEAAQKETEGRRKRFEKLVAKANKKKNEATPQKTTQATPAAQETDTEKEARKARRRQRVKNIVGSSQDSNSTEAIKPSEKTSQPSAKETTKTSEVKSGNEGTPKETGTSKIKIGNGTPTENKGISDSLAKKMKLVQRATGGANKSDRIRLLQDMKSRRTQMTSKPGYNPTEVKDLDDRIAKLEKALNIGATNEALSDLATLLLNTTITEDCFMEIMEMTIANKANALKVKDRYEKDMQKSLDDMNKELETNKHIDPESVKKASDLLKRKEHFEKMFNNKFNKDK